MAKDATIGVITEQGDLGLGFEPIAKKDQKTIQENDQRKDNKDKK